MRTKPCAWLTALLPRPRTISLGRAPRFPTASAAAMPLGMSENEAAIRINALAKTYEAKGVPAKRALDSVSFDVPRGQIFGLLGPNGAGKSTLINILAGLVIKSGGSATIWGFDIDEHPRNAKRSIGIVPQEILFDPFFTPREALEIQAGMYGVAKADRRTDQLLAAVRLTDKADAYARTLSGGMKRRLLVAKAMVHSPPILVLDEPTAGVDIELRQQLWDYVQQLNRAGVTVVLTTHYLEEAEQLCDRIAIINHGRLIANEPTRALIAKAQDKVVVVEVDRDIDAMPDAGCFDRVERTGERTLEIQYRKDRVNAGEVLAALQKDGLQIVDVSTRDPDLEDVFLALTREAAVA
jgi:ABC-2 type transport system ATP-binding protein